MASFSSTMSSPRTEVLTANVTTRNIVHATSLKLKIIPMFPSLITNGPLYNHRIFHPPVLSVSASLSPSAVEEKTTSDDVLPTPIVIIDQESDPDATVVELSFGDRLGALLDTMQALKELGLNVTKSTISVDGAIGRKRFSITDGDTGRKIEDTEILEAIRVTIIRNMLQFHPESSAMLAMGNALPAQLDLDINTNICITEEGPHQSLLHIKTADRPGLLREIVKILTDTNVTFQSGEFDTEGLVAKAKFHVKYRGAALKKPMQLALTNSIRYFLRRPETNEDSY